MHTRISIAGTMSKKDVNTPIKVFLLHKVACPGGIGGKFETKFGMEKVVNENCLIIQKLAHS